MILKMFFRSGDAGGAPGAGAPPIASIEQRLETATAELAQALGQLQASAAERQTLADQLAAAVADRSAAEALIAEGQTNAAAQAVRITELEADLLATRAELASSRDQIAASQSRISQLEKACGLAGLDPAKLPATPNTPSGAAPSLSEKLAATDDPVERAKIRLASICG